MRIAARPEVRKNKLPTVALNYTQKTTARYLDPKRSHDTPHSILAQFKSARVQRDSPREELPRELTEDCQSALRSFTISLRGGGCSKLSYSPRAGPDAEARESVPAGQSSGRSYEAPRIARAPDASSGPAGARHLALELSFAPQPLRRADGAASPS